MHLKVVCSCGALIIQCRCFTENRTVTVVDRGCSSCRMRAGLYRPLPGRCPYGAYTISACYLPEGHDGHHARYPSAGKESP